MFKKLLVFLLFAMAQPAFAQWSEMEPINGSCVIAKPNIDGTVLLVTLGGYTVEGKLVLLSPTTPDVGEEEMAAPKSYSGALNFGGRDWAAHFNVVDLDGDAKAFEAPYSGLQFLTALNTATNLTIKIGKHKATYPLDGIKDGLKKLSKCIANKSS